MKILIKILPLIVLVAAFQWPVSAADLPNDPHFHHLHLNVMDPAKSIAFYKKHLGAINVKYKGKSDAVFTERSFILMNKVSDPPPNEPNTAFQHMGWAGTDGDAEYEWLKKNGVEFQTHISSFAGNRYMYFWGPDRELIEIYTGSQNHRFEHTHFWAKDPNVLADWFIDHIGIQGSKRNQPRPETGLWMRVGVLDNTNFVIFGLPEKSNALFPEGMGDDFQPTKGHVMDHLAFSFRDIKPVFEKMKKDGVEIVEPIATREVGHDSFFVMAPGKLLIEIVQAKPIPDSSWE
jgi:catechol 2,3-dioxygenase-like lactoylglutathione lyase family enzyme